jgi:myo-inositol 2-dehydrogenase/D-chiro-inositol 1-dehydrogenase
MQSPTGKPEVAQAPTANESSSQPSRRDFFKLSTAAAVAAATASLPIASSVFAAGSDTLRYGLIGCGGRGSGAAANAMHASTGNSLVAMADLWPDKLETATKNLSEELGEQMQVPPDRRFVGIDAYKGVLANCDVVLLATPPHFRPFHLAAAIEAGKQIFCEKPVAVDVPGVKKVLALGEMAKQKNLNLVSGLCYRYDDAKRDTMAKIHDGAIGDIVALQGMYNTGGLWMNPRKPDWGDMEWQLRNWLYFTWLSGDHIVEQHIHTLDKMLWTMKDVPPSRVSGVGGRTVRTSPEYGNIYDHFATVYEWDTEKGPVKAFCQTRQWVNAAVDVSDTIYGTKGTANLMAHTITGETPWKRKGKAANMYDLEHIALVKAIRSGKTINNTDYMTKATLMGIMGRMAAYTGQTIYWDKAAVERTGSAAGKDAAVLMDSIEDFTPATYDPKAKIPTPPIAVPGVTKFS